VPACGRALGILTITMYRVTSSCASVSSAMFGPSGPGRSLATVLKPFISLSKHVQDSWICKTNNTSYQNYWMHWHRWSTKRFYNRKEEDSITERREAEGYGDFTKHKATLQSPFFPGRPLQLTPHSNTGWGWQPGSEFLACRGEAEFICQKVVSSRTLFPLNHPFC
jgi:hypothetical protein